MLRRLLLWFIMVLCLIGCHAEPAPTTLPPATAEPTAWVTAAPPTRAVQVSPTSPALATPIPPELRVVEEKEFRLSLPAAWTVLTLNQEDAEATFSQFEKENPNLAAALGGPEALLGAALWAFAPITDPSFADNLNVRRTPFDGPPAAMTDVVAAVEGQYQEFGFTLLESDPARVINGLPAAFLRYRYDLTNVDGGQIAVNGYQYLIASESALWILSFSAGPRAPAKMADVFASIVESFSLKK